MAKFKVGDRVRVVASDDGFYAHYMGRIGIIEIDDGGSLPLYVRFEGEEDYDWGRYSEVELVSNNTDVATIREAIANVEAALEALKALVG